jgi:hypothetical protein
MATQRYSVTPHPVETLLTWVKSGEIAIPEIQRPFVWDVTKVRNLLDSLYQGYPVGYLIAWRNPTVNLKDGTLSAGTRILMDGQQRVTALMAALLGREVLTKDYETVRIRIAFHPLDNIAIGDTPPERYVAELTDQCRGGLKTYGGITDEADLRAHLRTNGVPATLLDGMIPSYDDFLEERRALMAQQIRHWFAIL